MLTSIDLCLYAIDAVQSQIYREQVANVLEAMNHTHTNETVTELTES